MTRREVIFRTAAFDNPAYIPGNVYARADAWHRHGKALNDLYENYTGRRTGLAVAFSLPQLFVRVATVRKPLWHRPDRIVRGDSLALAAGR